MSTPEEFTITIESDGRIVLNVGAMEETSYKRLLEFLAETVGPARVVEVAPGDPPQRRLRPHARESEPLQLKTGDGGAHSG